MIAAGFDDPVMSAQSTFRAILSATARPGTVQPIKAVVSPPAPLTSGAAAVALTLCDHDTSVWLDAGLAVDPVAEWIRFHCGAKIVAEPGAATFAFASMPDGLPAFEHFNLGTSDYPDRSTTIVLLVQSFQAGPTLVLTGPGIRDRQPFRAAPLPDDVSDRLVANRDLFPRGVDLLLVTATEVAALPRSVHLLTEGDQACT